MPYIAQSVTDFWKRWHISLSRWMRDYLYIPLGGNRVPAPRLYFNLWVVFLISGFWHGAEWTFIAWGAYHGLFLALERLFLLKLTSHTGKLLRTALTFFIVVCGWVQFRAESITQAGVFFERMFSFHTSGEHFYSRHFYAAFFTAALLSFIPVALPRFQPSWKSAGVSTASTFFRIAVIICILVICLGEITSSDFNPFIYFKF